MSSEAIQISDDEKFRQEAIRIIQDMMEFERHCQATSFLVQDFLHEELSEQCMSYIRRHLFNCENCMDNYELEKCISALVNGCYEEQTAPAELKIKVVEKIKIIAASNVS